LNQTFHIDESFKVFGPWWPPDHWFHKKIAQSPELFVGEATATGTMAPSATSKREHAPAPNLTSSNPKVNCFFPKTWPIAALKNVQHADANLMCHVN